MCILGKFIEYGINDIRLRVREVGLDGFSAKCKVSSSESPSDKESVIVNPITPVYTLRKKRKMETVSVLTRLPCPMVP